LCPLQPLLPTFNAHASINDTEKAIAHAGGRPEAVATGSGCSCISRRHFERAGRLSRFGSLNPRRAVTTINIVPRTGGNAIAATTSPPTGRKVVRQERTGRAQQLERRLPGVTTSTVVRRLIRAIACSIYRRTAAARLTIFVGYRNP
jgi:hypothetical protein